MAVRRLETPTLARPTRLRVPMSLTGDGLRVAGLYAALVVAFSCLCAKPPPGLRSARSGLPAPALRSGTGLVGAEKAGEAATGAPPRPI